MALFQRKDINESEKRIFDALWKRYQENPEQFSETQVNALNELNKRLTPETTPDEIYDPKELVDEMRGSDPGERKKVLSDVEREFERRKGSSNKEEFDKLGYQRLKPEKKKPLGFLKNIFKRKEQKPTETTTETTEPTPKVPEEPKSTLTIEDAKYWYNRALEDNAHGGKSFEEWLKSDSDYKHLVEGYSPLTNVNNIIDRDEGQEIAMQTSSELEPEVESGWALNISDNPVLNSNNYYNVYGKTYTPPQGGIDIFKDPAAAYDAWVRELTIRSAPVEKGGLGEIQEGTGTYPFIVGVSPIQYWIEQGVLDFDLPYDERVELFKKAIESGKLTKELRIRESDKEFNYPEYGTQFANLLTLPDSIDELRRQRGEDWDLFYEVVGEQAESARYFFKLLKAYKEDGSLESARALNEFYEDLVPIAKESGRRTRDFRDAVVYYAKHPDKLVPFYSGYKEAEELGRALFILQAYEATGEMPSEEDMEFLRYIDDKDFSDDPSTTAAKIIDVFGQMVPFAGELKGLNVVGGMVNIFGQKVGKKYVGDAIRGQIKKVLSSKIGKTGKIITKTGVLVEGGYRADASKNKRLLHNYQINDDEIIVSDDKVSEEDAERWGKADAYIEYSSEMLGPALRVFGEGAKNLVTKAISKVAKIASKGEKDLIIGQSMASAIRRYIEKAAPDVKIDKKTLNNIRKELQKFGYDGFLEELGEERAGEAMRAFLYQLTESGIVEGFDNPEYVDNIWTMLSSGEYARFGEQMLIEMVALGTPGTVAGLYSIDARKGKEEDLKSSQREFVSKVEESNKKAEEVKVEVEETSKKIDKEGVESLSEEEFTKHIENVNEVNNNHTLNTLNELLIEDPALAKELDLSEVNLEEEIIKTAEQLEAEGVSVEGEGMDVDQKTFVARGYTVLANLKLKLGLGKGANYDTVVEEYYGIVRRGGLSKEQEEIYNQHYEKYETDAEYRKEINQFINDMAEKMGNPIEVADVNQTLSYDKLFDKEGKSYEYKSNQDKKNHQADSIFEYIKNLFSGVFDNVDKSIQDVYKKVRDRRLEVSAKRAQTTQERRDARRQERITKAEAKKERREKKREERKAKVDKKKERREKKREEARAKKKPLGKGVDPPKKVKKIDEKTKKGKPSYQLTPTQKEFFKDTKVVDSKGEPKVAYHGTPKSFEIFKETDDIGFHAGTSQQANQRLITSRTFDEIDYKEGGNVMPVYLNIKNPLRLNDINWGEPMDVIEDILEKDASGGQIPLKSKAWSEIKDVEKKLSLMNINATNRKEALGLIKNKLKELGFDGIVYENQYEGEGDSYIAFDANQIKSATAMAEQPTKDPRISYQLTPIGYQSGKGPSKKDNINMMFGRETGHFGSGTYFFGSEKEAKKHARGRKRPITEINLEGKNLFRPFDMKRGGETFKAGGNFGMANELHWILRYVNEASYKIGDYDAKNNPNSISWRDNPTGISKRLESWTGLKASPKMVDEVIQEVRAEIEANAGFGGLKTETASTRLMRRLGFDGIDMRGIEGFDNANFGSVLYADKPTKAPKVSYQLEPAKPTLYSPALRAIENLPQKSIKARGLMNLFKRAQVPPVELDWLGIKEWARENYKPTDRIPKEHIIEFIKQNESEVIDVTLGEDTYGLKSKSPRRILGQLRREFLEEPLHPAKFEKFTMVGGQDYKELLVRHPDGTYVERSHWDIPGIIVSLRLTTRFDTEGNKVLFIEEIQSDWTSEAHKLRKKEVLRVAKDLETSDLTEPGQIVPAGQEYKPKEKYIKQAEKKVPKDFGYVLRKTQADYDKARKELSNYIKKENLNIAIYNLPKLPTTFIEKLEDKHIDNYRKNYARGANKTQAKKIMELHSKVSRLKPSVQTGGFQDTPYKDGWIKLGVKKAILHAVNNNFDKIAVPTHEQIADMFDVSKVIRSVEYRLPDPTNVSMKNQIESRIIQKNGKKLNIPEYNTPEKLERYLGKGIVDRMLAGEGKKKIVFDIKKLRQDGWGNENGSYLQSDETPAINYSTDSATDYNKETNEYGILDATLPGGVEKLSEEEYIEKHKQNPSKYPPPVSKEEYIYLSGLDLRTPARFHKLVYDALANTLAKQGKRLGGKSGTINITISEGAFNENTEENTIPSDLKAYKVKRKSLTLTDNLKDKVRRTGIPSFQLAPNEDALDIYDDITGKEKFGTDAKKDSQSRYNSAIIPISTLLKRMDPKLYIHLLKHQFNVVRRVNLSLEFADTFAKHIDKMSKADRVKFKLAMLNSDSATLQSLVEKYDNKNQDFMSAYKNVRDTLDLLRQELIDLGEEVGIIEDYFPRKVTNYDGLINHLYSDAKMQTLIEKQLAAAEKKKGAPLSESEKADIIGLLIRGYSYLGSKPSYLKGRKIDKITPDMMEFYRDPVTQLFMHLEQAIDRVETRKFFGINNKQTQDMTQKEKSEFYDWAVGQFVQNLMDDGLKLTTKQQKEYIRILSAYFSFVPSSDVYGAVKTLTYGVVLGKFTNTITQFQDIVYAIYENKHNQIRTIKNLLIYLGSKVKNIDRIKRSTVGVDIPGIEHKMDSKRGFVRFADKTTNGIFTLSGFKLADGLGKSVLINSAVQKYKSKAQKNRLSRKDKDYLKLLFGDQYDQVVEELKQKTSPSEYTENELFIAYATILKYQPVGKTEVPLKYLESGDIGRTLYMLKTFAIKQLNVIRDESFDVIAGRQPGNRKMAVANMFYLMSLMVMAGMGGDEIKNWLKSKTQTWQDNAIDNILKIFLLNKYTTDKITKESAYKGVASAMYDNLRSAILSFPPLDIGTQFADDLWKWFQGDQKKLRVTRYVPLIGDLLYYQRDLSERVGVGGRGRDDYVVRKINAYYQKSHKDGIDLKDWELKEYRELLEDFDKYPQTTTTTKDGEEKVKKRINTNKHWEHIDNTY